MNNYAAHQALVAEILALCGARKDCRLWANNTGMARALTHDAKIKFGLKGSADILGIGRPRYYQTLSGINVRGAFLGIEAKTGSAKQSTQQRKFQQMIESFGGYYLVARSAQEVEDWLDRILG